MPLFVARVDTCSAVSLRHCLAPDSLHQSPSGLLLPMQNARAIQLDADPSGALDPSCLLPDRSFDVTSHRRPCLLAFSIGSRLRYALVLLQQATKLAFDGSPTIL